MLKAIAVVAMLCGTTCSGLQAIAAEPTTKPLSEAPSEPVYDVPRLANIVIDGRSDDWGSGGFRVDAMVDPGTGRVRPAKDCDPRFRLGWSEQGLLVMVQMDDDVPEESDEDTALFQRDSLELFVATRHGESRLIQLVTTPGTDARHPALRSIVVDHRTGDKVKSKDLPSTSVQLARTATAHGYVLEALLPWANLGLTPKVGDGVRFQLFLNDADGSARTKLMWYPADGAPFNVERMNHLRLSENPSPDIRVACNAAYEHFRRTRVGVVATSDLVGRTAIVVDGERQLGSAVLVADGRRASAEVICPMPEPGKAFGTLRVLVDGTPMASVELPNPQSARRDAFESTPLRFSTSVFTGSAFPRCEFEQPGLVEDLIGFYTLQTDFYAADFTPVKGADKPGRYGAVVTITAADGSVYKRFMTLFRQPASLNARDTRFTGEVILPPQMGIDPQVVQAQSATVVEGMKRSFNGMNRYSSEPAILLAGLFETKPDSPAMTQRNDAWAMDRKWWFELKRRTGNFQLYKHVVRLPKNYDADASARHPLILLLHGADGSRPDVVTAGKNHISAFADANPDFPFILVSPAGRWREGWSPEDLGALLDDVARRYRVDADRIYLTGLSMGGFGAWSLAANQPERFAAVVPVCGGGDPGDAERLKQIPIWLFHGDADASVPVKRSLDMYAALTAAGGKPRMSIYGGGDHGAWIPTYANPDLYAWLLEHRLSQRTK